MESIKLHADVEACGMEFISIPFNIEEIVFTIT